MSAIAATWSNNMRKETDKQLCVLVKAFDFVMMLKNVS